MAEHNQCEKCEKRIIETDDGIVHEGGGKILQICGGCGWRGGQVGSFVNCPSCGDGTRLSDHHSAS